MDRRDFLTAGKARKGSKNKAKAPLPSGGLDPYTGTWTENEVKHLLKRTMFGAKRDDVTYFLGKTMSQAVDELLNPTAATPAPPLKEYATTTTAGAVPDTTVVQGTTWVNHITTDGTVQSQRITSYRKWYTGCLINQDRSIKEKLISFWVDHFGNEAKDVGYGNWMYTQHMLIRQYCLGNFKQLVDTITKDMSMLRYLNGYLNQSSAPDENYGRELLELFTVGKGPGSKYTESDVKEAAKVLTGWQLNYTTFQSIFTASRHSTVNKTFSDFFKNTVITGRTGATAGQLELTDLLNMIFSIDEPAKFICRKLYRFFVYYEINSDVETNIITPLANIFRSSGYEIKPVLTALFKSVHFYDVMSQGCYIKTPADLVIGSIREMEVVFSDPTDWSSNYAMWNYFYSVMTNLGQQLHDPPNVSGLPAFYQEPMFHEIWINSDSLPKRNQYTDYMVNTGYTVNSKKAYFDLVSFVKKFKNPGNPVDLLNEALSLVFRNQLTDESKQLIKTQLLLTNQQWDYYWTNAWTTYIASPTTANFNVINTRLKLLFQYLFNLAEYQLI